MKPKIHKLFIAMSAASLFATPLIADKPAHAGGPKDQPHAAYDAAKDTEKNKNADLNGNATGMREVNQAKLERYEDKLDKIQPDENPRFTPEARDALNRVATKHKGWKHVSPLPPGLQKKVARGEDLPPGWQKKLQVGYRIPNNVYAYARRLPNDVYNSYPHPVGTEDILIEDKLYRITKKTREIVDIIDGPPTP